LTVTSDSILTIALVVGEVIVLAPIIRRRMWRILPVFSAYLVWALLSDLAGLYLQGYGASFNYLRFYTIEMTIDSILMFTVLVELGWSVLRPVRASLPRGTLFALAGLIAVAGLLIWPLAGMAIPPNMGPEGVKIFHLQETFAILRVACFLVMASFSQLLSIGWRDRELQIATGLGLYSIVTLMVSVLHAHQATGASYHRLDEIVSVSYLCTLSYWVLSFSAKEQERKEFSPQMQHLLVLMGVGARTGNIALTDLPSKRLRKKD
jgi:hypothetical protein